MHRCLDIQEIFSAILNHLGAEGHQSELARLARVCRRFTDQALNVLWKENVPLVALLQILPHDLWHIIPEGEQEVGEGWAPTTFAVIRSLKSTDWTPRFEYYSAKIKDYDQSCDEDIYIDPNVYKMFFSYTPFRYLLPNLKTIAFKANTADTNFRHCIPFFAILLNPNINEVYFHNIPSIIDDFDFDFEVFLTTITKHCPVVKMLTFFGDCNAGKGPALLKTLDALPCLQSLDVKEGSISSAIFTKASKLPELQLLYLDLFTDDTNDDREHIPQNLVHLTATGYEPFPQLRLLSLHTPNWGVASSIIGYCTRPLQTLSVYDEGDCPYYDHGSTFTALIGTITRNPHLSWSLKKLHIHGPPDIFKDPAFDAERVVRTLDGLFGLQSLEELSLVCCGLEQLTDAWLAKASTFWPNMRNLHIEGDYSKPYAAKFTFGGIVPLVERCKALEEIGLSLIWDVFSVPAGISNRAVTSITPGRGSYIRINPDLQDFVQDASLSGITNSLLTLFPRLARIDLDGRLGAHTDQKWEVIRQFVAERVFQSSSDRMVID